jgi:hypothetical protein
VILTHIMSKYTFPMAIKFALLLDRPNKHQNGGIRKVQYYLYPDLHFRLKVYILFVLGFGFLCFV